MQENAEKTDVNEVFTNLLLSEDRFTKEGYQEGFSKTSTEDNTEAFHLGYHRGAELGAEIGYYSGYVESYLNNQVPEKVLKDLNSLKILIDTFPHTNTEDDLVGLADKIRALFKKVCARLKVDAGFPKSENLSF